ncbi:MAG: zinc ribbon domain-containing protein [Phycisphaerae bacterium]
MGIESDPDLRQTRTIFRAGQDARSPVTCNDGRPLGAIARPKRGSPAVTGRLTRPMPIAGIRQDAAASVGASSNGAPAPRPFAVRQARALVLVGTRGRDADVRADGPRAIGTVAGRTRRPSTGPDVVRAPLPRATVIERLPVIERDGPRLGRVTVMRAGPAPVGAEPVGIDRHATHALVAVDPHGATVLAAVQAVTGKTRRTQTTRAWLQRPRAVRTAARTDPRRVCRGRTWRGRSPLPRTLPFARQTGEALVPWGSSHAGLVVAALRDIPQPKRGAVRGHAPRRRFARWQRRAIRSAVEPKAQGGGLRVTDGDPDSPSPSCSRCGVRGNRARHRFGCPSCGSAPHADMNAAQPMRRRAPVLRNGGTRSPSPEALRSGEEREGKRSPSGDRR